MTSIIEEWRDIKGFEGFYQVSNLGRVKRIKGIKHCRWGYYYSYKHKVLTPTDNGHGYLIIGLRKDGKRKNYYIHRLVAETFLAKIDGKNNVNHLDYDRTNNKADNLEWCTQKENVHYSLERMKVKHNIPTNTGIFGIIYRAKRDTYRIIINSHEYGCSKSLETAIKRRDEIMKELGISEINNQQQQTLL